MDIMDIYFASLTSISLEVLPKDKITSNWIKAKSGDKAARETLIHAYLRLSITIAKRFMRKAESPGLAEYIAEANLATVRAIDDWEGRGNLTTWVSKYVKTACYEIIGKTGSINVPSWAWLMMRELKEVQEAADRYFSVEELSEKTGYNKDAILGLLACLMHQVDSVEDPTSHTQEVEESQWCLNDVEVLISSIHNEKYRKAFCLKYGLKGHNVHSYRKIASIMGTTQAAAHGNVQGAIRCIRKKAGVIKLPPKTCEWCGKEYTPKNKMQKKFCSRKCNTDSYNDKNKRPLTLKTSNCLMCGKPFIHRAPDKIYCNPKCSIRMRQLRRKSKTKA